MLFMFAAAVCLQALTREYGRLHRFRNAFLVISIFIVGIWLSATFSALHVFNILLGRITGDPLWLVIVIGTLVSLVLAGRLYCGWLCPLGALLELLWKISPFKADTSGWQDGKYRNAKYVLLVFIGAIVLMSGRPDLGNIEPYVTLFSFHGNMLAWIVLICASILPGLLVVRFWCRYLCPAGAVLAALSPYSVGYPGSRRCPMGNLPGHTVENDKDGSHASECIRCNVCAEKNINSQDVST
jgi:NosR/NirI family nitrous oxide reductase transcriptional regulator